MAQVNDPDFTINGCDIGVVCNPDPTDPTDFFGFGQSSLPPAVEPSPPLQSIGGTGISGGISGVIGGSGVVSSGGVVGVSSVSSIGVSGSSGIGTSGVGPIAGIDGSLSSDNDGSPSGDRDRGADGGVVATAENGSQQATIIQSLVPVVSRQMPSDDPTLYPYSNFGNEELWNDTPGASSNSSFAAFTFRAPRDVETEDSTDEDQNSEALDEMVE